MSFLIVFPPISAQRHRLKGATAAPSQRQSTLQSGQASQQHIRSSEKWCVAHSSLLRRRGYDAEQSYIIQLIEEAEKAKVTTSPSSEEEECRDEHIVEIGGRPIRSDA